MYKKQLSVILFSSTLLTGAWVSTQVFISQEALRKIEDGLTFSTRSAVAKVVDFYYNEDRHIRVALWPRIDYQARPPLNIFHFAAEEIEKEVPATDMAALSLWQRQELIISTMMEGVVHQSDLVEQRLQGRELYVDTIARFVHNQDPLCAVIKDGEIKQFTNYSNWSNALASIPCHLFMYNEANSVRAILNLPFILYGNTYITRSERFETHDLHPFKGDYWRDTFFSALCDLIFRLDEPLARLIGLTSILRLFAIEVIVFSIVGALGWVGSQFLMFISKNS